MDAKFTISELSDNTVVIERNTLPCLMLFSEKESNTPHYELVNEGEGKVLPYLGEVGVNTWLGDSDNEKIDNINTILEKVGISAHAKRITLNTTIKHNSDGVPYMDSHSVIDAFLKIGYKRHPNEKLNAVTRGVTLQHPVTPILDLEVMDDHIVFDWSSYYINVENIGGVPSTPNLLPIYLKILLNVKSELEALSALLAIRTLHKLQHYILSLPFIKKDLNNLKEMFHVNADFTLIVMDLKHLGMEFHFRPIFNSLNIVIDTVEHKGVFEVLDIKALPNFLLSRAFRDNTTEEQRDPDLLLILSLISNDVETIVNY